MPTWVHVQVEQPQGTKEMSEKRKQEARGINADAYNSACILEKGSIIVRA